MDTVHLPVLPDAVKDAFSYSPGVVVDATGGGGGHTQLLLDLGHEVICLDRDPVAASRLRERFSGRSVRVIQIGFGEFEPENPVDGILADIGLSSDQLADPERGFSFTSPGPPDMRMDPTRGESAAELIARMGRDELADLIYKYGEERESRAIARVLAGKQFDSSESLARAISGAKKPRANRSINPATKTFQALRIAVNDELGELERLLDHAPGMLKTGGRIAIITFHSLEDRIVKETFARWAGRCECPPRIPVCVCNAKEIAFPLWKGARTADERELGSNPRSRSAKIRAMVMR